MKLIQLLGVAALVGTLSCGSSSDSMNSTGPGNPGPPGPTNVTIQNFSFAPANVSIKVGGTVKWTNKGPSPHTTTSDQSVWASSQLNPPVGGGGGYGGGGGMPGGAYTLTFHTAGTYGYHCSIHPPSTYPGFTGTVVVNP
ncbi:MAG TPA: plastocyanin/azurin family copper-binding protein [Gemmatimonadales bacterium]